MIDLAAFIGGVLLLATTAILGASLLRIRGRAAFLIAALMVGASTIVLLSIVLSFFTLYQRGPMLGGQVLVVTVITGVWLVVGHPRPPGAWSPQPREIWPFIRAHRTLAALCLAAMFAFAIEAILAVGIAPNNFDSMTYHLARIGFWFQYDSVFHFPGGSDRQLLFPPNAEILQGWTLLLSGGDRFAQLVQWFALAGSGLVVYSGACLLRFTRPAAIFAGALFVIMPEPVLQATTTQNDLLTALFIGAAGLFGVRGVAMRSHSDAAVAALAVGLAVGTKGTGLVALPALTLIVVAALLRWRPPRRAVLGGAGLVLAAILVLGAPNYIENLLHTGSPFGSASSVSRDSPLAVNAAWLTWQFVDFPGFAGSWFVDAFQQGAQRLIGAHAELIAGTGTGFDVLVETEVHEDFTAYGPVGAFVLLPLLVVVAVLPRVSWDKRVIALGALGYLGLFAVVIQVDPWSMRLVLPAIVLGAPLLGELYRRAWMRHLVAVVALVVLIPCLFQNAQKRPTFLGKDRITQQAGNQGPGRLEMLQRLDKLLGSTTRLGVIAGEDAWQYPLFGAGLERYVSRYDGSTELMLKPRHFMRSNDFEALIVTQSSVKPPREALDVGFQTYVLLRSTDHIK